MVSIEISCNDVIVVGEKTLEKICDICIIYCSGEGSRWNVAIGDVKGGIGVYFGDNGFDIVLVWGDNFGEM